MRGVLRFARPEDVSRMLDIYAPHVTDGVASFEYAAPTAAQFAQRVARIVQEFPWIVCEVEGRVAGYAYASHAFERAAYQWDADVSVYLDAAYQRRGLARLLYRGLEALLSAQGYYTLYACITACNAASIALHEACGYARIGLWRASGFKHGRWLDVAWYEKRLRVPEGAPIPPCPYPQLPADVAARLLTEAQSPLPAAAHAQEM